MSRAVVTFAVKLYKPTGVTLKELRAFMDIGLTLARDGAQRDLGNAKLRGITVENVKLVRTEMDYTK